MLKFLKNHGLKIVIIVLILCGVYLGRYARQQNIYEKNPGLIPPAKNYDIQITISTGDKLQYEATIKKYNDLIKNFKPGTGTQEIDLGNGIKGVTEIGRTPDEDWFVEKAKALLSLGRYTEAIKTLNSVFKRHKSSTAAWNNLGEIYEQVGEYKKAIMNYKKLIETMGTGNVPVGYYYKMAELYIKLGNGEEAGQQYIQYEENGGARDAAIMSQIKELNK